MRLELFVLGLTAFFVYNAYHDGKYTKMLWAFKKYYKMIFYVCLGVGIYILLKRNPNKGRNLLLYANNMVRFMPIDRNSMDMLSPIIDFTGSNADEDDDDYIGGRGNSFMETFNDIQSEPGDGFGFYNERKMAKTKRSVSETKKKYVASGQDWKCGHCRQQLDHTFEIDHRVRLEYGGSNDVNNLVALCRNCHGKKTASENM